MKFEVITLPCSVIQDIYYVIWTRNFQTLEALENYLSDTVSPFILRKVLLEKYQIDCFLNSGLIKDFGFSKSSDFFVEFNKKIYKLYNKRQWKDARPTCEELL